MEPPRSGSERVAELLGAEPELDEVSRARMEKHLLESVRMGEHLEVEEPEVTDPDRSRPTRVYVLAMGAVLAAAAAVAIVVATGGQGREEGDEGARAASFLRYQGGQTTDRGTLAAGRTVSTVEGERVEVRVGDARVDVTPGSEARFDRLDARRVEVALHRGSVEVELHPARSGDQTLRVTTTRAYVDVVGTIFRVSVDDAGNTMVSTVEGTVRVTPRERGEPRLVGAGEMTTVRAPALAASAPVEGPAAPRELGEEPAEGLADEAATDGEAFPPSIAELFARAESRLDAGDHRAGRRILGSIVRRSTRGQHSVRAHTLLAESFAFEGRHREAAAAYSDAVDAGGHSVGAQNALFAMGRLYEREMHDVEAATAAYRRYLSLAPGGAHADQIHRALCGMGHEDHCP